MSAPEVLVVGIDPGPMPGLVALDYYPDGSIHEARVVQCTANAAEEALRGLLISRASQAYPVVQIEKFVVGRRATRSSTASAGAETRRMVELLAHVAEEFDAQVHIRSASEVKPWATDARLEAGGLADLVKGMRHAKDAARHALFAASKNAGIPDPLSKRSTR